MTNARSTAVVIVLGVGMASLLASDAATVGIVPPGGEPPPSTIAAQWHETKWPFPLDQWGIGRAFRCGTADCGFEVKLYLRPKIGFCNCTTGVSDDAELERVGDIEILSDRFAAMADGRAITVGWMKGRSRPYAVAMHYASPLTALSIAFNDKCDVAVATVVANRERLPEAERLALAFLNGKRVLRWAKAELGSDGF
jgi:hypothetical protein